MQSNSSPAAELQRLLTIPPADFIGSPHNAASVAHAALQALRDSGDAQYLFIRTILELQHDSIRNEELLFYCVTSLRHVILHKWESTATEYRNVVRDYMMALGLQAGLQVALPRTVQLACFTTAVAFWKRQWNKRDDCATSSPVSPEEGTIVDQMKQQLPTMVSLQTREDLFYYIESLLKPSDAQQMALACTLLSVLIGEFSGKSAVHYRLPLEFHKRAHGTFERDGWLDICLRLSMGALSYTVGAISENPSQLDETVAVPVVQLTSDVIGWQFGVDAWDGGGPHSRNKTLIRPPLGWKEYLIKPGFVAAIFQVYERVARTYDKMAHSLRQLLLLLASLSGPVLADESEQKEFTTYLLEGSLKLLSLCSSNQTHDLHELIDVLSIISRIIANFKLSTLVDLPAMVPLLNGIASTGASLLQANVAECEAVKGDMELMENLDAREEALAVLLDGVVLLCGDPWLLYASNERKRKAAHHILASSLGSLYIAFITSRIRMAKLEEHYLTVNAADLDEVTEEIASEILEEEMGSTADIGRLSLDDALNCLASLFQTCVPQIQVFWNSPSGNHVHPEGAACLEEMRLLIRYLGHLLTDDNAGETPVIPESIVVACQGNDAVTNAVISALQTVMSVAEMQASKIAQNPSDSRLSPLLASSMLWFLNRWAPAYVYPVDYSASAGAAPNKILTTWANSDSAQQVISFCATLCLHYQCYWPQERLVQEGSQSLILALAKRGPQIRSILVASPSFVQMVMFHCLTAGMRHASPKSELEASVQAKTGGSVNLEMVRGFQRLRYEDRSSILTAILVATSDSQNETANAMMNESLVAVQEAFSSLLQAITTKQIKADDVNAEEMTCLCVEMYGGVARAGDMAEPERIILFITPSLPHLSGLMGYYAEVLVVCEGLLRLFRDYAEHFVASLDRQQSLALFTASADILERYSSRHCASRVIKRPATSSAEENAEEEQSYSDVLCAIQLLIHLGTKDFIDICTSIPSQAVDSNQITDVIFFGLKMIIPLMTRGLLQYPTLCTQYISLVGFMVDTYPDKVCVLPFELFDALWESLLFGMSHLDPFVSQSSLRGIASLVKEHLKTKALAPLLAQHADIVDKCTRRLLQEVIFTSLVWDRLEPCGAAMLPLAAVDPQRFVAVVNELTRQVPAEQQVRLQGAFEKLINVEALEKVSSGGYAGRQNRVKFKRDFDEFTREVHSFLVVK